MISHPMPAARPARRGRLVVLVVLLLLTLAGLGCATTGAAMSGPVAGSVTGPPHCPLHDEPAAIAPVAAPAASRPGSCGDEPASAPAVAALLLAPVPLTTATRRGTRLPGGRRLLLVLGVSRR